jgi:hypothetical protein
LGHLSTTSKTEARAAAPPETNSSQTPARRLPDPLPDAMDPGFHCVRTHWIRGFITFQLARRTRIMMLMVPRVGSGQCATYAGLRGRGSRRGSQAGAARFPGAFLSRWPLRACCYRRGSADAARSRASDPAATRAEPSAILGLRRCTARAARRT